MEWVGRRGGGGGVDEVKDEDDMIKIKGRRKSFVSDK